MRKLFASTMLFLLMLLSVGAVRCQARCSIAMPPMPVSASHGTASMGEGMEHCNGMQDSMLNAEAACGMSVCQHQILPAAPDARAESGSLQQTNAHEALQYVAPLTANVFRLPEGVETPPLLQRSPLDQSSSLRV